MESKDDLPPKQREALIALYQFTCLTGLQPHYAQYLRDGEENMEKGRRWARAVDLGINSSALHGLLDKRLVGADWHFRCYWYLTESGLELAEHLT